MSRLSGCDSINHPYVGVFQPRQKNFNTFSQLLPPLQERLLRFARNDRFRVLLAIASEAPVRRSDATR